MDERRIRELTDEVLSRLRGAPAPPGSDLPTRVAALEAAVRDLREVLGVGPAGPAAVPPAASPTAVAVAVARVTAHPSLQVLPVGPGSDRCVLEPDKPCVGSGQCRALGH